MNKSKFISDTLKKTSDNEYKKGKTFIGSDFNLGKAFEIVNYGDYIENEFNIRSAVSRRLIIKFRNDRKTE